MPNEQSIFQGMGDEQNLPRNVSSLALANFIMVKSGQGILYGFTAYSNKGTSQFIQVFDANALPSDGAIPVWVGTVGATSNLPINWIPGRTFLEGCVICNSSTVATKTIASADTFFDVQFV